MSECNSAEKTYYERNDVILNRAKYITKMIKKD